jgi:nucleotide-binding universal stress UspA family protein
VGGQYVSLAFGRAAHQAGIAVSMGSRGDAYDNQADQIVVGAHGPGRIRALLGTVSHELPHIADRPVVLVPAPMPRPEA